MLSCTTLLHTAKSAPIQREHSERYARSAPNSASRLHARPQARDSSTPIILVLHDYSKATKNKQAAANAGAGKSRQSEHNITAADNILRFPEVETLPPSKDAPAGPDTAVNQSPLKSDSTQTMVTTTTPPDKGVYSTSEIQNEDGKLASERKPPESRHKFANDTMDMNKTVQMRQSLERVGTSTQHAAIGTTVEHQQDSPLSHSGARAHPTTNHFQSNKLKTNAVEADHYVTPTEQSHTTSSVLFTFHQSATGPQTRYAGSRSNPTQIESSSRDPSPFPTISLHRSTPTIMDKQPASPHASGNAALSEWSFPRSGTLEESQRAVAGDTQTTDFHTADPPTLPATEGFDTASKLHLQAPQATWMPHQGYVSVSTAGHRETAKTVEESGVQAGNDASTVISTFGSATHSPAAKTPIRKKETTVDGRANSDRHRNGKVAQSVAQSTTDPPRPLPPCDWRPGSAKHRVFAPLIGIFQFVKGILNFYLPSLHGGGREPSTDLYATTMLGMPCKLRASGREQTNQSVQEAAGGADFDVQVEDGDPSPTISQPANGDQMPKGAIPLQQFPFRQQAQHRFLPPKSLSGHPLVQGRKLDSRDLQQGPPQPQSVKRIDLQHSVFDRPGRMTFNKLMRFNDVPRWDVSPRIDRLGYRFQDRRVSYFDRTPQMSDRVGKMMNWRLGSFQPLNGFDQGDGYPVPQSQNKPPPTGNNLPSAEALAEEIIDDIVGAEAFA